MVTFRVALFGAVTASAASGLYYWVGQQYNRIAFDETPIAIDDYVGVRPSFMEKLQVVALYWYTRKSRTIHSMPYKLVAKEDPRLPGVKRTGLADESKNDSKAVPVVTLKNRKSNEPLPLVIGTIRMGYGHHRLAYAAASFATDLIKQQDPRRELYFHDIATIGDDEGAIPDEAEDLYRAGSQALSEAPDSLERFISKASAGGGPNALRIQVHEAALMTALMEGLDKDSPLIATHPLVGAIAKSANFTKVINLVVDNHAQWFVVVPGAINLIQGPRLYRQLLMMGVPEKDLKLAAHWNPKVIVDSIPEATERRMERARQKMPLRLLVPVGGAGAQQTFLVDFVKACASLVRQGRVQLFLNAGDHRHMKKAFTETLEKLQLDFDLVTDLPGRDRLKETLKRNEEPSKAVTLLAFDNSFAAVTTTDELIPGVDVLVCKPSEMAFYAVPKLHIRRVGDHEAKSAVRAAEIGDGTLEAATVPEAMANVYQMLDKQDDLLTMNEMIRRNHKVGMYDGAKIAVEMALAM